VLYFATWENKPWTPLSVVTKVSVITCESKHLIFATPKFQSHHRLSVKVYEGAPSPTREVSSSDNLSTLPNVLHRWWLWRFCYNCRLGYLLCDTSPPMLLLVWGSSPTMYLFRTRLSESAVFGHLHSLTYAINLLRTNLDTTVLLHGWSIMQSFKAETNNLQLRQLIYVSFESDVWL
jgi:hypothetical protein